MNRLNRVLVVALASYSIVAGLLLGFAGPGDAFKNANPVMFARLSSWLSR